MSDEVIQIFRNIGINKNPRLSLGDIQAGVIAGTSKLNVPFILKTYGFLEYDKSLIVKSVK